MELKNLLSKFPEIEIIGEAKNAEEGKKLIESKDADLIFLDIHMPGKTGFELLEEVENVPYVIFTTAYDQYAIKSFEYNTLDYLLKPINHKRLESALLKAQQAINNAKEETTRQDFLALDKRIFIKEGDKCWLVELHKIAHFESMGNYTKVHFDDQAPMLYKSLNKIEERLQPDVFFRANRQSIINVNFIQEVVPWFSNTLKLTLKNGNEVEVSRRQSSKFKQLMSL